MAPGKSGSGGAHFSTDDLRPADRFSYYREFLARNVTCEIEPLDDRFRCDVSPVGRPGFGITRIATSPVRASVARQMAANVADNVLFMVLDKGKWAISQHRRELSVGAPCAVLMTTADPMTLERSAARFTSITIPRATFTPMVRSLDAALMSPIPRDLEAIRLLINYLKLVAGHDTFTTSEVHRLALTHVHDLVAVALGATREAAEIANGRGVRAARLGALKSDILLNLGQHDLAVGTMAARQGISESYVRKLFEGEGTSFTDFVLEQRLAHARRLLGDPRYADRSITSIAFDAGFGDLSYFTRCFRKRFGETPSAVRAEAARQSD